MKSKSFKSNQIKSLLLSHHHSTSALVSEILMSVLQTVQKNNRQFTYGQTVQKNNKQFTYGQTVQKNNKQFTYGQTVQKNNNSNLHMDRQCKKTTNNLHMDRQCKKTALEHLQCSRQYKKNNRNLHMDRQCKKTALEHLQCSRQCKKKQQQFTYGQYIFTDCTEDNVQNTHTYTQYTVYYKDILNYQRHIIHRMGTSTLCTVSIHNVHNLRHCIDSNTTTSFKLQKGSK